jgi:hypothetical protein
MPLWRLQRIGAEQLNFLYEDGAVLPDPRGGNACRGTAVHKTVERWFRLQLAGTATAVDDMAEFYDDAWDAAADETSFAKDDDIAELKRGYIDLVDVDGRIIDLKTSGKKPIGIDPGYAFQLATYQQLLPGSNGKTRLDTLVATKAPYS